MAAHANRGVGARPEAAARVQSAPMLRAILFDFNGVLVDDEPIHLEMFQRVLAEEGIALTAEEYYRDYLGFDDRACFAAVLARAGRTAPEERLDALISRKAEAYQQRIRRGGFPFFPGAAAAVRRAAAAGLRLGIVSGALRHEIEGALGQEGLIELFDAVVSADEIARSKPAPDGYRRGLELLAARLAPGQPALRPREVLAVEDSPAGLAAAHGAGMPTLGVAQTYAAAELAGADLVIERLADLDLDALRERLAARGPG